MTTATATLWNVARSEYFAARDLTSSTDLRTLKASPPRYKATIDGLIESDDTDSKLLGSAIHQGILEPEAFQRSLAFVPLDGRSAEAKWWRMVCAIIDAARDDYHASALLRAATFRERAIRWTDAETGIECKALIDLGSDVNPFICDVKTCADPSPEAFSRDIAKYGYQIQAAHYAAGFEAVYGVEPQWFWLAVGKTEPYELVPYLIEAETLAIGREERRKLLLDLKARRESGDWSSRHVRRDSIATIALPRWYRGGEIGGDE